MWRTWKLRNNSRRVLAFARKTQRRAAFTFHMQTKLTSATLECGRKPERREKTTQRDAERRCKERIENPSFPPSFLRSLLHSTAVQPGVLQSSDSRLLVSRSLFKGPMVLDMCMPADHCESPRSSLTHHKGFLVLPPNPLSPSTAQQPLRCCFCPFQQLYASSHWTACILLHCITSLHTIITIMIIFIYSMLFKGLKDTLQERSKGQDTSQ